VHEENGIKVGERGGQEGKTMALRGIKFQLIVLVLNWKSERVSKREESSLSEKVFLIQQKVIEISQQHCNKLPFVPAMFFILATTRLDGAYCCGSAFELL
jgi:hypothetical protein